MFAKAERSSSSSRRESSSSALRTRVRASTSPPCATRGAQPAVGRSARGKWKRASSASPQARAAGPVRSSSRAVAVVSAPVPVRRSSTLWLCSMTSTAPRASRPASRTRASRSAHCSGSRSWPEPPGRSRPRPKRLPQRLAVRLRKSPRMRPFQEDVGRKPVSPAMAPRSPTWLASRSSSSPMRRRRWARGAATLPARRSSSTQWAVACPTLVSPAAHSSSGRRQCGGPSSTRRSRPRCW